MNCEKYKLKMWKRVISGGLAGPLFEKIEPDTKRVLFNNAIDPKVVIFGYDLVSISTIIKNVNTHLKLNMVNCDEKGNYDNWINQGIAIVPSKLDKEFIETIIKRMSKLEKCPIIMLWGDYADINTMAKTMCKTFALRNLSEFPECNHLKQISTLLTGSAKVCFDWRPNIQEDRRKSIFTNNVVIFTDGSCNPNKNCPEAVGGYSAVILCDKPKILYGRLDTSKRNATNIRAEGMAIIKSLEYVKSLDPKMWNKLYLISDCEMWCNMITSYMKSWTDEKFASSPNPDITKPIWYLWNIVDRYYGTSSNNSDDAEPLFIRGNIVLHMKSHNKNGWKNFSEGSYEKICFNMNDIADRYAKKGRELKNGEFILENME